MTLTHELIQTFLNVALSIEHRYQLWIHHLCRMVYLVLRAVLLIPLFTVDLDWAIR